VKVIEGGGVKKSPSNTSNNKLSNQPSTDSQQANGHEAGRRVSNTSSGEWYVAVYEFDAVEPTDLSLRVGDRIWVTGTASDWWTGTVNGKSGIFPANYVEKVTNAPALPTANAPTSPGVESGKRSIRSQGHKTHNHIHAPL
jgi:hypothetical protein